VAQFIAKAEGAIQTIDAVEGSENTMEKVVIVSEDGCYETSLPIEILPSLKTISNMLEDIAPENEVRMPVPHVGSQKTLDLLREYAERDVAEPLEHEIASAEKIAIEGWEKEFFERLERVDEQTYLFQLVAIANYLEYNRLYHTACQKVAHLIEGKTPEQLRELFGMPDDLTAEEKERLYAENGLLPAEAEL